MTGDGIPRSGPGGIDGLNALLRGELAAVNAYQRALRSAEGSGATDAGEILRFASEHQRTVAALQGAVRELGGVPTSEAATWGAFARLRDAATLRELLAGEVSSLGLYESAAGFVEGTAREFVTLELIPRQREHIAGLSAVLSGLTA